MLGESDDRHDDLGADRGLELADELDPMDADTYGDTDDSDQDADREADVDTDVDPAGDADDWDTTDGGLPDESDESDDVGDTDLDVDTTSAEVPYEPLDATPETPTPPVTGDETVDDAMLRLAQSQSGSFAERIDAGEHAHRSLQSRLGGLGGA